MGMMIVRETAVELIGDSRLALLKECVDTAWSRYDADFRPILPLCSPVGMANILRELIIEDARGRLTNDLRFQILDGVSGGRFLTLVDGTIVIQFRKLTRDFLTRNNPTATSDAFDRQEPDLDGVPDTPRLTVGYQLGQYRTALAGTYLAFVVGNECVWHHDLATGEHSITLDFPPIDGPSAAEQEAEAERRRKAEGAERDEEQEAR